MAEESYGVAEAAEATETTAPDTSTGSTETTTATDSQSTTVTDGAAQTQTATTTAAATWRDAAVDPEVAALYGVKTMADWDKKYRASSGEARKQAQRASELEKQLEAFKAQGGVQNAQQGQQTAQEGGFLGFKDIKEYQAEFARDPMAHAQRMQAHFNKQAEGVAKSVAKQMLDERFAPMQQKEQAAAFETQKSEAFTKYPEFAPGTQLYSIVANFAEANPDIADALRTLKGHAGVNVVEMMGKIATYDLLKAQGASAAGKQKTQQARASVARPGVGGNTKPARTSITDAVLADSAKDGLDSEAAAMFAKKAERGW